MRLLSVMLVVVVAFIVAISSCAKEYSYEGGPLPVRGTLPPPPPPPPLVFGCSACAATMQADSSWRFYLDGQPLCGRADKAILTFERTSFTFFGPSYCSPDSGFVVTVYLSEKLDRSKKNINASYVSYFYYDGVTPSYVLQSRQGDPFSFFIEDYNHETGIVTGGFTGVGYTVNNDRKEFDRGRFRIRFK